jgi:hypothetical protein
MTVEATDKERLAFLRAEHNQKGDLAGAKIMRKPHPAVIDIIVLKEINEASRVGVELVTAHAEHPQRAT